MGLVFVLFVAGFSLMTFNSSEGKEQSSLFLCHPVFRKPIVASSKKILMRENRLSENLEYLLVIVCLGVP